MSEVGIFKVRRLESKAVSLAQVDIIRGVEVEVENKMQDLTGSLEFERGARVSNTKRAAEHRKKLQKMKGADQPPPPASEEELQAHSIGDLEFRYGPLMSQRPDGYLRAFLCACCWAFLFRFEPSGMAGGV